MLQRTDPLGSLPLRGKRMGESRAAEHDGPEPKKSARRGYARPALRQLGDIADLTRGQSPNGSLDGQSGMTPPFP